MPQSKRYSVHFFCLGSDDLWKTEIGNKVPASWKGGTDTWDVWVTGPTYHFDNLMKAAAANRNYRPFHEPKMRAREHGQKTWVEYKTTNPKLKDYQVYDVDYNYDE